MLRHLTSCCRPPAPRSQPGPGRSPAPSPTTATTAATDTADALTIVDLTRFDAKQLLRARPRGVVQKSKARKVEIRLPPRMERLPSWVVRADPSRIELPDFDGRSVKAVGRRLERLTIGGRHVRRVETNEGCEVSVPCPSHEQPVRVDWVDPRRGTSRTGRPRDHLNFASPAPDDATLPYNGSVNFSTPWYTQRPIVCRHMASSADQAWSDAEDGVDDARPTQTSRGGPCATAMSAADKHARHARRVLGTVERFQEAVPYRHEARFYDLISQSSNATIIENPLFPDWIARQFAGMSAPRRRTYLMITDVHVMNLALELRKTSDGTPLYRAIYIDPNAYSEPFEIETASTQGLASWSLERFLGTRGMRTYLPPDPDGTQRNTCLLVETPRGHAREAFDARADREVVFQPRLTSLPHAMDLSHPNASFVGQAGLHHRTVLPLFRQLSSAEVFRRMKDAAVLQVRLTNGDAREISQLFETITKLFELGKLDRDQAAAIVMPGARSWPPSDAVIEGRADALSRWREGLGTMMADGILTARHGDYFLTLFGRSELSIVETLLATGTEPQKAAAAQYKALLATVATMETYPDQHDVPPVESQGTALRCDKP